MSDACSTHTRLTTWPLMSMPRMFPACSAHLVGVVGELDPAGLAAPADLDLGLDDHRVARRLGRGDRLVDRVGRRHRADRDAVAGEVLLALVLEQVHSSLLPDSLGSSSSSSHSPIASQRRPGTEQLRDALRLQRLHVRVGDRAAAEHEHVVEIARPATPPSPAGTASGAHRTAATARPRRRPLAARSRRSARRLVEPGVDHLESVVTQRPRDRLRTSVVPVEAGLGHDDSVRPLHEVWTLCHAGRAQPDQHQPCACTSARSARIPRHNEHVRLPSSGRRSGAPSCRSWRVPCYRRDRLVHVGGRGLHRAW